MWNWNDGAFGSKPANQNPSGNGNIFYYNLRLPGQFFDKETNNNYNGNRDYAPIIGRYLEVDPNGLAAGVNPMVYVGGNPIGRIDPRGLAAESEPDEDDDLEEEMYGPALRNDPEFTGSMSPARSDPNSGSSCRAVPTIRFGNNQNQRDHATRHIPGDPIAVQDAIVKT